MTMELALLRAARPQLDPSREAFAQRLERIEQALEGGAVPVAPAAPATPVAPASAPPAATDEAEAGGAKSTRLPKTSHSDAISNRPSEPTSPEPASGEPTAPEPEPAKETLDLERLVGLWPAVMDQVRSGGSELLSSALEAARPIAVDVEQAVVQVGFPVSAGFNKRKAEAVEARDKLADAVKTIVGERLRPVYVVIEGEEAPAEAQAEADLSDDEKFEKMKDAFDGVEFDVGSADGGDAGSASMDAGLDAGPGIDTGEAA